MTKCLFALLLFFLPWWGSAAESPPRAGLVIDTSGSMADNDPRRYAVHFAKVLGQVLAGTGALDAFHAKTPDCRDESDAEPVYRVLGKRMATRVKQGSRRQQGLPSNLQVAETPEA